MRLINDRSMWMLEGMHLVTVPANQPLDHRFMSSFFPRLKKTTALYQRVADPIPFARTVLIKPNNNIVIVPLSPDVRIETGQDQEQA